MATAKTIKEYRVTHAGYEIVVPVGSTVTSCTAMGDDQNYRFWIGYEKQIKKLTGSRDSLLARDLWYTGLNIPAEYCEPYPEVPKPTRR